MLSASLKFLPQNHHHLRNLTEKIYLVELSGIEPLTSSLLKAERRILNNKKIKALLSRKQSIEILIGPDLESL